MIQIGPPYDVRRSAYIQTIIDYIDYIDFIDFIDFIEHLHAWESRGCEKPKPPKAAQTNEPRNAEDAKGQNQKATRSRINQ